MLSHEIFAIWFIFCCNLEKNEPSTSGLRVTLKVAHNPEVGGSNPSPATKSVTVVDTISTTVIFYLFPFWGCFWYETGNIPNISSHKQIVCPDLMRPWSEKAGLGKIETVIRI